MKESKLEGYFKRSAKRRGGFAVKLYAATLVGFPDRTVFAPGARIGFAELKRPGKKARATQVIWLNKLREWGFIVAVISDQREVDVFMDLIFGDLNSD